MLSILRSTSDYIILKSLLKLVRIISVNVSLFTFQSLFDKCYEIKVHSKRLNLVRQRINKSCNVKVTVGKVKVSHNRPSCPKGFRVG